MRARRAGLRPAHILIAVFFLRAWEPRRRLVILALHLRSSKQAKTEEWVTYAILPAFCDRLCLNYVLQIRSHFEMS